MEIHELTALELGRSIRAGEIGVREAAESVLRRIADYDPLYGCYTNTFAEEALTRADEVQAGIRDGRYISPLAGVPAGIKDLICTRGFPTTCSSRMLEHFVPPYDATVIERLNACGYVILGKLNMDEFAMGSSTENSYMKKTRNPYNPERVPGGSSGGSAAAVSAGLCSYALGSDTGGSIRQPASFCGVTGMKPSYGTVSRFGLVAYASSLDQIGPVCRDAADCAAVLSEITCHDPRDTTSIDLIGRDYLGSLNPDMRGKKFGIPKEYLTGGLDAGVRDAVLRAAKVFTELGAELAELSLPTLEYAIPAYYIIASAEAASNLARYDGVKYGYRCEDAESVGDMYRKTRTQGFGAEVKRRIMLGNFVLSSGYYDAYYKKAQKVRALIKSEFGRAFTQCDLILGPVAPTTAMPFGENADNPLKVYLGDYYTVAVNLAGLPAMSVPCGFDKNKLPVGLQIIGNGLEDAAVLSAGYAFQCATDYHRARPALRKEL